MGNQESKKEKDEYSMLSIHGGYHECIQGDYYILYSDPPNEFIRVIQLNIYDSSLPYSQDITSDFLKTFPLWRETFHCTFCSSF